jgi:hypothetical protein
MQVVCIGERLELQRFGRVENRALFFMCRVTRRWPARNVFAVVLVEHPAFGSIPPQFMFRNNHVKRKGTGRVVVAIAGPGSESA